jgi:ABC-type taurine transport system ATPase subunit
MLDRLIIRNFKQFEDVDIELGQAVVFVGPNNAGKTSALQALALWELGIRRWTEKRSAKAAPKVRSGVTMNRRDLVALPVPETKLLWRDLHVRRVSRKQGKQKTENIRLQIIVEGVFEGRKWTNGLEFDYANAESIYCRPLGWAAEGEAGSDPIGHAAQAVRMAYLPPMSGLIANELRMDSGAIQVRLGEGRTAEVLRNLCHSLAEGPEGSERWLLLEQKVRDLFGITLQRPEYIAERGELSMGYTDPRSVKLDISAAGRGLQQTLLLLAFLLANPGCVLLLDEPDAHLEILRQRQIYGTLTDVARLSGSQIIAASHSEVILNEAADRDVVVAFVGKPHRIDDRGSQVAKSLKSIGFDQYYLAEEAGWVLYLEGATDLAILRALAKTLNHPAAEHLERPFTHYILNQPGRAHEHLHGLREAKPDLLGLAVLDNLGREPQRSPQLPVLQWNKREIENYLCFPSVLEEYAARLAAERSYGPLFESVEATRFREVMRRCVEERVPPVALRNPADRWWQTVKASDDFLDPVFESFFAALELPNLMRKSDYHRLADLVPQQLIDPEVSLVLDQVVAVASSARPAGGEPTS